MSSGPFVLISVPYRMMCPFSATKGQTLVAWLLPPSLPQDWITGLKAWLVHLKLLFVQSNGKKLALNNHSTTMSCSQRR